MKVSVDTQHTSSCFFTLKHQIFRMFMSLALISWFWPEPFAVHVHIRSCSDVEGQACHSALCFVRLFERDRQPKHSTFCAFSVFAALKCPNDYQFQKSNSRGQSRRRLCARKLRRGASWTRCLTARTRATRRWSPRSPSVCGSPSPPCRSCCSGQVASI